MIWLNCVFVPKCKGCHPPKNKVAPIAQTTNMFTYSARKNKANFIPEYSVWKPAVSSDSASAKSKGALLVSATDPIKNIINIGNKGSTYQIALWDSVFTVRFKLPVNIITKSIAELNTNS